MRVVHVMESTIGGTRRHLVDAARGQARAGLEVHVIASCERVAAFRDDLAALQREGVHCYEVPMQREIRPRAEIAHARAIAARLRAIQPAIVHTHSSKGGALGRIASIATRQGKRVHTPHTFAFLFGAMFSPLKRRLFHGIESVLGARTDRMIAVSRSERATIERAKVTRTERLRVVANGIDPKPWRMAEPLPRGVLGAPKDKPLAAVVGLLNAAKGQDLAIEMLARDGCRDLHLLVVGHGEERAALEALAAARGVAARTHFLGWRDDVPRLLAACDFVLLPSRWEGMPYIVLEAFAAGRPVVAAAVDGATDLVVDGENGYLAAVGDADDLARATRQMLGASEREREACGRRARARVLDGYTVDHMVRGLVDVYRELA
ncbi:MAG: glycosyltransferase family 1 protein [Planctomycetota bacterium]|nr:MAG: glycosyltransferase family 1 protein [Planctomycetota bacterium]